MMLLKVIWSKFAESQLDEIFERYEKIASTTVAKKLLEGIINEPTKLLKSPYIGQKEELLKDRQIEYRYLVFKSFKLIYSIDKQKGAIKIADVFDTRQTPPEN